MDEWLLAWPNHKVVDVYHHHHWVASFAFEADARNWIRSQGGEASN